MALDYKTQYPAKFATGNADYPFGVPQNITVPNDGTGSPWEAALIKDYMGLLQGLLDRAGITPSGNPDTAVISDYLDALDILYGAYPMERKTGLTSQWDSNRLITTRAGTIRNQADTRNMSLATAMQKDFEVTWAVGDGNGGMAQSVSPTTAQFIRRFIVEKPDGTADIVWDTSIVAANFFASGAGPAAGYSDNTLYRRIAWEQQSTADELAPYVNNVVSPNYWRWTDDRTATGFHKVSVDLEAAGTGFSSRTPLIIHAPPNVDVEGMAHGEWRPTGPALDVWVRISNADDIDRPLLSANASSADLVFNASSDLRQVARLSGKYPNVSSELFIRYGPIAAGGGVPFFVGIDVHGWYDNLLAP